MLKKHSRFFESLLLFMDWFILSISWISSYYLRMYSGIVPVYSEIPPMKIYLSLLIFMIPLWGIIFKVFGLYRPRRISTRFSEVVDIVKASTFATLALLALTFFIRQYAFSRLTFFYFWLINIIFLSLSRIVFREFLRFLRKKGYNQRHALIVGTERLGQDLVTKLRKYPELGIQISGFLTKDTQDIGREIQGIKVVGRYADVRNWVVQHGIDILFISLPFHAHNQLREILNWVGDEAVSIIVVPDLLEFMTLRGNVSEFEGMPLISL